MATNLRHRMSTAKENMITSFRIMNLVRQNICKSCTFQQLTKKVPSSYDGRNSWFAYADAIDDWSVRHH